MKSKHSQGFLRIGVTNVQKKILGYETTGEVSSGLKACTTHIVSIFEQIC